MGGPNLLMQDGAEGRKAKRKKGSSEEENDDFDAEMRGSISEGGVETEKVELVEEMRSIEIQVTEEDRCDLVVFSKEAK